MKGSCPQLYNQTCYDDDGWQVDHYHTVPAWAGLVSSLLSVLGCVLMLISYQRYRDFRTGSRKVATWLSVSNLGLAMGYAMGSLNFIIYGYSPEKKYCAGFSYICWGQALVTWTFALASFVWTVILAWYLFLTLVKRTINTANHWLTWIVYYVVSLAIPLGTMTCVAVLSRLGYSPYATGGTCFVSTSLESINGSERYGYLTDTILTISFVKGLEMTSYVIVILLFSVIQFKIVTLPSLEQLSQGEASTYRTQHRREWRLIAVPIFFVSLRMWGTISTVVSIALFHDDAEKYSNCISDSKALYGVLFCLDVLQAIGDPGLGWGNSILFVFLSPKVRQRMFGSCLHVWPMKSSSLCVSVPVNATSSSIGTSAHVTARSHRSVTDFESFVSSHLFLDRTPGYEDDIKTFDLSRKKSGYQTFSSGSSNSLADTYSNTI